VIHLRETCCCSTNLCTWRPNTVYKNRSVCRHQHALDETTDLVLQHFAGLVNYQSMLPIADMPVATSLTSDRVATPSDSVFAPKNDMITRLWDNTRREKTYTDSMVQYDPRRRALFAAHVSHHYALCEPAWHAAMLDEFSALSLSLVLGFLCLGPQASIFLGV
jgi:hypothetical protein